MSEKKTFMTLPGNSGTGKETEADKGQFRRDEVGCILVKRIKEVQAQRSLKSEGSKSLTD